MKIYNYLIAFSFILFTTFAFSADYIWPGYVPITVPDSLKNEDAFFISKNTTYDFYDSYKTSITFFNRMYINSNKGVERFSTHELPLYGSGQIVYVKTRIIKPNGQIIDISKENIKETFIKGKFNKVRKSLKRIQFIYPDLQKGDVIDIAYELVFPYYIQSDMLYLESYLPSLYSKISIRNLSRLQVAVFTLNNTIPYKWKDNTFTWEDEGVSVIKVEGFNAIRPNFPRFYYTLFSPNHALTYDFIYNIDTDRFPVQRSFKDKFTAKLLKQNLIHANDSTLVKVAKLINAFQKFTWINDSEINDNISHENYFDERKINEELFFKYIQHFLDENDISYGRGFTNSLFDGPFDKSVLSYVQFQHRFLTLQDYSGNLHYIFPPSETRHFYSLDEIPYYCEGNSAILMVGTDITLMELLDLSLPKGQTTENKHLAQVIFKIQNNDIASKFSRKDVLSGHFSNLIRGNNRNSWIKNFGISDTIINLSNEQQYYPYEIEFRQDSMENHYFQEIDDSLFWFNGEKLISDFIFEDGTSISDLGDYLLLPFKHLKSYSFYIENEKGIKCKEKDLSHSLNNTIGEISSKCIQINPTMIKIEYNITLKENIIDGKNQVQEYLDFMQKWKELRNKKWIIQFG